MRYDYQCEDCKKQYGVEKKLADFDEPVPCPHCNKPTKLVITKPVPFRM